MTKLVDVANAADVSISVVSRILNEDPSLRVAAKTRERVLFAARELISQITQRELYGCQKIARLHYSRQITQTPFLVKSHKGLKSKRDFLIYQS